MLQLIPLPVGNGSFSAADVTVPAPVVPTAIVYPMDDPAVTVELSAVLVKVNAAHCTVVLADACTVPVLPALAVAVFAYVAQLPVDVANTATCTDAPAPVPRFPKLQLSVPPDSVQLPGPLYAGLMLQPIPDPEGNGSLNVTDVAVPAPPLLTARV